VGANRRSRHAQDAQCPSRHDAIPFAVVAGLGLVEHDDERGGVTVEVSDKAVDELLPPEMQAAQLVPPERLPEDRLLACHAAEKLACPLRLFVLDLSPGPSPMWGWELDSGRSGSSITRDADLSHRPFRLTLSLPGKG